MAKEQYTGSDSLTRNDLPDVGGRRYSGKVDGPWDVIAKASSDEKPKTPDERRTTGFHDKHDYLSG